MQRSFSKKKLYDLRKHFKKRMRTRFNLELNRFDLRELIEYFQQHRVFIRKESNMKSWWFLHHRNRRMFLLYDNHRNEFITVYTLRMMIESSELKNLSFDPSNYKT